MSGVQDKVPEHLDGTGEVWALQLSMNSTSCHVVCIQDSL